MSRLRRFFRDLRQLARTVWSDAPDVSYEDLRRSEELYRLLAENAQDIIWLLDFPNDTRYVSPACEAILGWPPEVQVNRREGFKMLTDESAAHSLPLLQDAIARRASSLTYEAEHLRADGSSIWCEVNQGIIYDDEGRALSSVGVTRDISEKRRLQEQLARAQKTEAIGALAGGVAHDFNNFLTVIIGCLELVAEMTEKDDRAARLLSDALEAAERSSALTGQLLAFSRHQPVSVAAVDINALVRRADSLMRRAVGERIGIDVVVDEELALARVDENQIHQVVVNLVMNARDAIHGAGSIVVETANAQVERESADARSGVVPGPYVMITVSDDGTGMDESTRQRATEPFFSTKEKGSGTGLGLAMTKTIVDQAGGALSILSEAGVGTRVKVYVPAAEGEKRVEAQPTRATEVSDALRGSETIVVVEDEAAVRSVASRILKHAGYTVHATPTGAKAMEVVAELARTGRTPGLVLSDLVMPGMDGAELARALRESQPALRFVIMSGYAETDPAVSDAVLPGPLLTKPFHANELLRAVRHALDASEIATGQT